MKSLNPRINTFLTHLLGIAASFLVLTGCESSSGGGGKTDKAASKENKKEKKVASTIRLFMETRTEGGFGTRRVQVPRRSPVEFEVRREAFIDEGEVKLARVINTPDGAFVIALQLTTHGQMVLQMETTSNRGRRIGVFSQWSEGRWLAAPQITRTIEDGVFMFTPDCTREEAERIVKGLNNVAIAVKNQPKPGKKSKAAEDEDDMSRFKTYR